MGYGRLVRRYLDPLLSKLLALLQNGKRIVQEQASARWGPSRARMLACAHARVRLCIPCVRISRKSFDVSDSSAG